MNTSAIILMVVSESIIAAITVYLFLRVLKTPPQPEPDSYSDNDDRNAN